MAENKKSYVFYLNWYRLFDRLDRDRECQCRRCKLGYLIQDYVNDVYHNVPVSEISSGDDAVDMAFQSIVDDLKPDLEKWKDTIQKRAIAGQLGGLARANNLKQNQANQANAKTTKQNQANQAVNEYVNDNVNVNDNVLDKSNNKNTNVFSAEMAKNATLTLPTIQSSKGNEYPIYQEDIDKWQSVYIGVDVLTELKKMRLWLEANPKSKKTYQGIPRFINSWLSREQDKTSRTLKNNPVGLVDDDPNGGFTSLDDLPEYSGRLREL